MKVEHFKKLAEKSGLPFEQKSLYHFHLKGVYLLNVYPTKGTYYVQGTEGGLPFKKFEDLIKIAQGEMDVPLKTKKTPRKALDGYKARKFYIGYPCFVCGRPIDTRKECSVEHKIPLSRGGSNREDNLDLSHYECNWERGNSLAVKREVVEVKEGVLKVVTSES